MTNLFVSLVTSLLPSFSSAYEPSRLSATPSAPSRSHPESRLAKPGRLGRGHHPVQTVEQVPQGPWRAGKVLCRRGGRHGERKGQGQGGRGNEGEICAAGAGADPPQDWGELMEKIDGTEWRSMALNMVGSAAVQVSGVTASHHVASSLR